MHPSRIPALFLEIGALENICFSVKCKTIYKKCNSLAFPPVLAEWNLEKMRQSRIPRLYLLITQYSNCSSQISKKFKPWKKVAPAIKVIVWDF